MLPVNSGFAGSFNVDNAATFGFSLFVQECVRAGFPLLTLGAARSDLTSSALGAVTLGSSFSLHGASQAEFALPVLGSFHIEPFLSLQKLSHPGSSSSAFGQA